MPDQVTETFHGTNGETLQVGHDEDSVFIRGAVHVPGLVTRATVPQSTKLSAATARELARHLNACADLADDWMSEASDPGPAAPEPRS